MQLLVVWLGLKAMQLSNITLSKEFIDFCCNFRDLAKGKVSKVSPNED